VDIYKGLKKCLKSEVFGSAVLANLRETNPAGVTNQHSGPNTAPSPHLLLHNIAGESACGRDLTTLGVPPAAFKPHNCQPNVSCMCT
jgi:hypothetical protein